MKNCSNEKLLPNQEKKLKYDKIKKKKSELHKFFRISALPCTVGGLPV
jgi:hypothetical protein